ncbi:MAG: hypothetical protein AB1491_03210 [Thermodesulfobacteriota bacterium]
MTAWQPQPYAGSYSTGYRRRRTKTDWAGITLADAFKSHRLDYFLRLQAQRLFYQAVRKVQKGVAALTGAQVETGFEPKVKPQLGPCYTSYPAPLAAYAAIGLTGFLEFEARVSDQILFAHLEDYLENPAKHDKVRVDHEVYEKMAKIVCWHVQTRLLLEDLWRHPPAFTIELYRLFAASQLGALRSVPDILKAVILFGDLLPDWPEGKLHPLTRHLLTDLSETCAPFLSRLPHTQDHKLLALGMDWVRAVCRCLAPYLPDPESETERLKEPPSLRGRQGGKHSFSPEEEETELSEDIPPLLGPHPPSLFDTGDFKDLVKYLVTIWPKTVQSREDEDLQMLVEFARAVEAAAGQSREWEDMRFDLVELFLKNIFQEGPIKGNPISGQEVCLRLGSEEVGRGEIFDEPLELSDDLPACERLRQESYPITAALRRNLYPSLEEMPETERLRSSGSLDPARLPQADFSEAIFKRYRIRDRADPRGRAVILIACDGSASLSDEEMKMVKILAAAWLNATMRSDIQVLAGLYTSGRVREGVSGPVVRWIFHPRKTPALSRVEAFRALASVPDEGRGAQSDALSLAFMLKEARRLARGKMVYLIVISDCKFNKSFHSGLSGTEEVHAFFQQAYAELSGKLHTTLVALGVSGETGLESLLDKVIPVSDEELTDYQAVAGRISAYVSSCLRERRRWLARC